jgi:hypothetical protein
VPETIVVHLADGRTYERRRPGSALDRQEHGLAAFQRGCRCSVCRAGRRRYDRERYALLQLLRCGAINRRVPARRAAEHLEVLRQGGWSWPAISAATGFSIPALVHVRRRPQGRCWSLLRDAVLELEP